MIAQSSGTVLALNRSTPRVTLLSKPVNETEERIQFTGARLATEEIAAHALSEHVVDGFYMKEITYPLGYRVPSHWHTNASLFIVFSGLFTEFYGTRQIECVPLDIVLTPRGETHSEYLDKKDTRSFLFEFEPDSPYSPPRLRSFSDGSYLGKSPRNLPRFIQYRRDNPYVGFPTELL